MQYDLIHYISGSIPFGIWLLPIVGAAFTFVWWVVWIGTKFWSMNQFWKTLVYGWLVTVLLYSSVWLADRPSPIPQRVMIVEINQNSWEATAMREIVYHYLDQTTLPLTIINAENAPSIKADNNLIESIDNLASKMRCKWIIKVQGSSESEENECRANISLIKESKYLETNEILADFKHQSVKASIESIHGELSRMLGENFNKSDTHRKAFTLPDSSLKSYFSALRLFDLDSLNYAEEIISGICELENCPGSVLRKLAYIKMRNKPGTKKDEIHDLLIRALHENPNDFASLLLFGEYFLHFREWDEAESALKLALSKNSSDPRIYFYLSRLDEDRLTELKWETQKKLLKRALHLSPGYEAASLNLSDHFKGRLEKRQAILVLEEGLQIDSNSVALLLSKSALQLEMSFHQSGIETCKRILEVKPLHSGALYNIGMGLIFLEKFDEGISYLERSLANGGSVDNYYYMGIGYERKGDFDKAIYYFEKRHTNPLTFDDKVAFSAKNRVLRIKKWLKDGN